MYRRIDDFVKDFNHERESTLKVFRNLSDETLSVRASELSRTINRLAAHITIGQMSLIREVGLKIPGPERGAPDPTTVAELTAMYDASSNATREAVVANWTDDMMETSVNVFGQQWPIGVVLSATLFHQCHHRGQLTTLMRQAGLKVPGLYGPSQEEWASMGMPAPI